MMDVVDTTHKAYALGYIAADAPLRVTGVKSAAIDCVLLESLRDIVQPSAVVKKLPQVSKEHDALYEFLIHDRAVLESIWKHIGVTSEFEEEFRVRKLPNLASKDLTWAFIAGVFDVIGGIKKCSKRHDPECYLEVDYDNYSVDIALLKDIAEFAGIPHAIDDTTLLYSGVNCMDFLGYMHKYTSGAENMEKRVPRTYMHHMTYVDWATLQPAKVCSLPTCSVFKADPAAILPSKARPSDAGYDLSVIKEHKRLTNNVVLYDSGIKLRVSHGMYAEVVPRSSLSNSGYMLANSIGIIDASYNGNIYVALAKIDPDAPDIQLPFRCCQILFRKQVNVDIVEAKGMFDETHRQEGGFGSSGV